MATLPRIEELRRRVEADPASIAFAQLGEEYRRAGNIVQAIRVCRTGLTRHPEYLSARVTLGRALLAANDLEAARGELETVVRAAPENLAAVRCLAEIHHRRGDKQSALHQYRAALQLVRQDAELEQIVADLERELIIEPKSEPAPLSLEEVQAEFVKAFPAAKPDLPVESVAAAPPTSPLSDATASQLARLEQFLNAIISRRAALR